MLGKAAKVELAVPEAAIAISVVGLQPVTPKGSAGDGNHDGGTLYLTLHDAENLREQLDEVISALALQGRRS